MTEQQTGTDSLAWKILPGILLANGIAAFGQFEYAHDDWHWSWPLAILAAVAIESLSVATSALAHDARVAGDSAGLTWPASYAFGLLAAFAQLAHYGAGHPQGWILGAISAASPFLWSRWSVRLHRNRLRAQNAVPPKGAPLGGRWITHPRDAVSVWRYSTWHGLSDPVAAIESWEASRRPPVVSTADGSAPHRPGRAVREGGGRLSLDTARTDADRIRVAVEATGGGSHAEVARWLEARRVTVTTDQVRKVRSRDAKRAAETAVPAPGDASGRPGEGDAAVISIAKSALPGQTRT